MLRWEPSSQLAPLFRIQDAVQILFFKRKLVLFMYHPCSKRKPILVTYQCRPMHFFNLRSFLWWRFDAPLSCLYPRSLGQVYRWNHTVAKFSLATVPFVWWHLVSRHRLSFALGDDWTRYSFDYSGQSHKVLYRIASFTGVYVPI